MRARSRSCRTRAWPLAAALLLAGGAQAGLFDDDVARQRIEQLRQEQNARLDKLEAASRAQLELANQLESLKAELARLRGQLEVTSYELDNAQKRQRDFYVDRVNRLRKLETAAVERERAGVRAEAAKPDPAAESRDFETALQLVKTGKFKEASSAFSSFVQAYPESSFLPSAHFWRASSLAQSRDCDGAAQAYRIVLERWPDDARAPDALLGLSGCQQELKDAKAARQSLEALVAKYPKSGAADVARQRLKSKR